MRHFLTGLIEQSPPRRIALEVDIERGRVVVFRYPHDHKLPHALSHSLRPQGNAPPSRQRRSVRGWCPHPSAHERLYRARVFTSHSRQSLSYRWGLLCQHYPWQDPSGHSHRGWGSRSPSISITNVHYAREQFSSWYHPLSTRASSSASDDQGASVLLQSISVVWKRVVAR